MFFNTSSFKALALAGLILSPISVWANTTPTSTQATAVQKQLAPAMTMAQLQQHLKNKQIPFDKINPSKIKGMYEIHHQNEMAYVDATGQYLFVAEVHHVADLKKLLQANQVLPAFKNQRPIGRSALKTALFDTNHVILSPDQQTLFLADAVIRLNDGSNITKELEYQANAIDWHTLPLKDAIKDVRGTGEHKIAVFSDPFCPYCKRLEQNLQQLNNVTIYTFLYPLKTNAKPMSEAIWCAKNPAQAWNDMMLKNIRPAQKTCTNPLKRNLDLGDELELQGTPTIIFENGFKIGGAMPVDMIKQIFEIAKQDK